MASDRQHRERAPSNRLQPTALRAALELGEGESEGGCRVAIRFG